MYLKPLTLLTVAFICFTNLLALDIKYNPKQIKTKNATMTLKNRQITINMEKNKPWPGISIAGPWDLSKYSRLEATVKNTGKYKVRFCWRVDNPGANGVKNCLNKRYSLEPGEEQLISIQLIRKIKGKGTIKLKGMHSIPDGLPSLHGIDPSNIVRMVFFGFQSRKNKQVTLRGIVAKGKYVPFKGKLTLPFVDEFGQYKHVNWTDKIKNNADLHKTIKWEQEDIAKQPVPPEWNMYGGWANGPQLKKNGHFYTTKYNNKWTLVDPDGKLFFSIGMDCVNIGGVYSSTPILEREKWFDKLSSPNSPANRDLYFVRNIYCGDYSGRYSPCYSFIASNLKKKFGRNWKLQGTQMAPVRLKSWGFNTIGNWSDYSVYRQNKLPYTVGVAMAGAPARILGGTAFKLGCFYDPYDKDFSKYVDMRVKCLKSITASKWCIGIFFDNELYWDKEFGMIALTSPGGEPAKTAFIELLKQKYGDINKLNKIWGSSYKNWADMQNSRKAPDRVKAKADLDKFYLQTAEAYFKTVKASVKKFLPGKLYLGSRFARVTPLAYIAAAKYCDVVSFNIYEKSLENFLTPAAVDAPLMVGEFHFGAKDRGMFGGGMVKVDSQQERADCYKLYVKTALRNPQFVGCHWFQYYDQPLTGRAFNGENHNIGFLNSADAPYKKMISASREVANEMYKIRFPK